jgi:hypothetical protein
MFLPHRSVDQFSSRYVVEMAIEIYKSDKSSTWEQAIKKEIKCLNLSSPTRQVI